MTFEEYDKGELDRPPNPAERTAASRKADSALEMKLMGMRWDEVAEHAGYASARSAQVAVEKSLQRNLLLRAENTGELRALVSARYDRLIRSIWRKAMDPGTPDNPNTEHLAAVKLAADLTSQIIKLHGLAAPTEIAITTPTQKELEEWVTTVGGETVLDVGDPFDIVDAELIDDRLGPDEPLAIEEADHGGE